MSQVWEGKMQLPGWLITLKTILLAKNADTKNFKNYRLLKHNIQTFHRGVEPVPGRSLHLKQHHLRGTSWWKERKLGMR